MLIAAFCSVGYIFRCVLVSCFVGFSMSVEFSSFVFAVVLCLCLCLVILLSTVVLFFDCVVALKE